jgi:hypothetical protein
LRDEQKVAVIGDQDLAVAGDVAGHLRTAGNCADLVARRLDLQGATRRQRAGKGGGGVAAKLVRREEAAIRDARPGVP